MAAAGSRALCGWEKARAAASAMPRFSSVSRSSPPASTTLIEAAPAGSASVRACTRTPLRPVAEARPSSGTSSRTTTLAEAGGSFASRSAARATAGPPAQSTIHRTTPRRVVWTSPDT